MNKQMVDQELLSEFITEATEHLSTSEEDILTLEAGGPAVNNKTVNRLFRSVHTIKGASGFLALHKIERLSHSLENIVGLIRSGKLIPSGAISEILLKGVDKVKALVENVHDDTIEIDDEIAACEGCFDPGNDSLRPPATEPTDLPASFVAEPTALFDMSRYDLGDAIAKNRYVIVCTIDLIQECVKKKRLLTSILEEMKSIGEIWDLKKNTDEKGNPITDGDGRSLCSFLISTIIDNPDILAEGLELRPLNMVVYTPKELALLSQKGRPVMQEDEAADLESAKLDPGEKERPHALAADSSTGTAKPVIEQTVRISVALLDKLMNMASELVLVRNQNTQALAAEDFQQLSITNQQLNIVTSELQNSIMQTRMQPVGNVFNKFTRIVRDLAKKTGKEVDIVIEGSEVELDKSIIETINDPLTHLIRNSVDHGIESPQERQKKKKSLTGKVCLSAFHRAGQVNIQIVDDGKGLNPAVLKQVALNKKIITKAQADAMSDRDSFNLIFEPGFSTAAAVTEVSGRGVGMDVVKTSIQKLGGAIDIISKVDQGTTMTIMLPLTLAIMPALIVSVESVCFAIPQTNIIEVVWIYGESVFQSIKMVDNCEVYALRGRLLPLLRLSKVLQIEKTYQEEPIAEIKLDRRIQGPDRRQNELEGHDRVRMGPLDRRQSLSNNLYVIILRHGNEKFGLIVDTLVDTEEIVVKPLHEQLKKCKAYAGTTVMGDGRIAMILDIMALSEIGELHINDIHKQSLHAKSSLEDRQTMILFDIGGEEQFVIPLCLITRVEEIHTSQLQKINNRDYFNFREKIIPIIRIEQGVTELKSSYDDCRYIIIPKGQNPIGIMVAHIQDTLDVLCKIDSTTIYHKGIFGSQLINGKITLFLDSIAVIEAVEPGWFLDKDTGRGKGKNILCIDDSVFYQKLITSYLRSGAMEVTLASNGQEALDVLSKQSFDGVVCDLEMPIMDGFEFVEHFRANPKFTKIPLLAISAGDENVLHGRSLDCGFDDFKPKSNLEGLLETITNLFVKKRLFP